MSKNHWILWPPLLGGLTGLVLALADLLWDDLRAPRRLLAIESGSPLVYLGLATLFGAIAGALVVAIGLHSDRRRWDYVRAIFIGAVVGFLDNVYGSGLRWGAEEWIRVSLLGLLFAPTFLAVARRV
jgi:hypothetical protein